MIFLCFSEGLHYTPGGKFLHYTKFSFLLPIDAVEKVIAGEQPSKKDCHEFVRKTYDWRNVAERTEIVYDRIMADNRKDLAKCIRNLWECGRLAGPLMAVLYLFCHYWILVMDICGW